MQPVSGLLTVIKNKSISTRNNHSRHPITLSCLIFVPGGIPYGTGSHFLLPDSRRGNRRDGGPDTLRLLGFPPFSVRVCVWIFVILLVFSFFVFNLMSVVFLASVACWWVSAKTARKLWTPSQQDSSLERFWVVACSGRAFSIGCRISWVPLYNAGHTHIYTHTLYPHRESVYVYFQLILQEIRLNSTRVKTAHVGSKCRTLCSVVDGPGPTTVRNAWWIDRRT